MMSVSKIEGRVISQMMFKRSSTCSAKMDLLVLTVEKILVRITLWPPHNGENIKEFGTISVERPVLKTYEGQCFSTSVISKVQYTEVSPKDYGLLEVSKIGGIKMETIAAIRTRVSDERPGYGFIRGVFLGFDQDIVYEGCKGCKAKNCGRDCQTGTRKYACVKMFLEIDQIGLKVTVFEDVLDSLLGCRSGSILQDTNDGTEALKTKLQGLTDRKIGLKVKVQKRTMQNGEEGSYLQTTACLPFFVFQ